jgi:hypothetical protein
MKLGDQRGTERWLTLLAGAIAFCAAGLFAAPAHAGIANTKHNLSTGGIGPNKVTVGTDEICVFCHTPHAADTTAPAPLWNKSLGTLGGYTTYATLNSSTIDGTILNVGSISLACLSCHDGTQAMDNIINAPGPGGYSANGGGALGLNYTWNTAGGGVDADGRMKNTLTTLSMLDKDLSNDHPIGIHYCGGGPNAAAPTANCVDTDFVKPTSATINANLVWWVDTSVGTAGTREKSDMILYTRNFGGAIGNAPSVECGSCHDPHVESNTGVAGETFLRIKNTGSAVCLACHVK